MDKREHVIDFIDGCAEHSAAQLATALINWIGDTDELIDMASRYLGYNEPEDNVFEDEDEEPDPFDFEREDDEDDIDTVDHTLCAMCGDPIGLASIAEWVDDEGFAWTVHAVCYNSGRYLDDEQRAASEARKDAQ